MARAATLKLPPRLAGRLVASPDPGAPAASGAAGESLRSWRFAALAGRLAELSSREGAAGLTLAFSLVLDAQRAGEPVGWLTADESAFFPPDAARGGVDLDALVVVRLPAAGQLPRAAEHLARSGAFGLLVLDLGEAARVPVPMQMRLLGLAREHESAVLFLTRKGGGDASLGSLVSLRAEAGQAPAGPAAGGEDAPGSSSRAEPAGGVPAGPAPAGEDAPGNSPRAEPAGGVPAGPAPAGEDAPRFGSGVFTCTARVLKDKRGGPGWQHVEVCHGPDGLC